MYSKTTPDERKKLNRAIIDRMPATYKAIYEKFALKAKGINFFSFYHYARKLRAKAELYLTSELLTPDPAEIPKTMQRLAGTECIDALLHAEEEGSAKKLAKNSRIYLKLRDQDLKKHIADQRTDTQRYTVDQRRAAQENVATIRREGNRECTEIRAATQRDCSQMRAEAHRDTTNTRADLQRDLTRQRLDHQHDTVQFKADCAAALHNARYPAPSQPAASPPLNAAPYPPLSSTPEISNPQSEFPPVSNPANRRQADLPGVKLSMVELIPRSARSDERSESAHTKPRTPATGFLDDRLNPSSMPGDYDDCLYAGPDSDLASAFPSSHERSESHLPSEIRNPKSEIPRRCPARHLEPFLQKIQNPHVHGPW